MGVNTKKYETTPTTTLEQLNFGIGRIFSIPRLVRVQSAFVGYFMFQTEWNCTEQLICVCVCVQKSMGFTCGWATRECLSFHSTLHTMGSFSVWNAMEMSIIWHIDIVCWMFYACVWCINVQPSSIVEFCHFYNGCAHLTRMFALLNQIIVHSTTKKNWY